MVFQCGKPPSDGVQCQQENAQVQHCTTSSSDVVIRHTNSLFARPEVSRCGDNGQLLASVAAAVAASERASCGKIIPP